MCERQKGVAVRLVVTLAFFHFLRFFLAASLAFFAASLSALPISAAFFSCSFVAASAAAFASAAFCFSAGVMGLGGAPLITAPPPFFFASRAAFSSALIRLIRGSLANTSSTRVRSRTLSSFFLLARSDLFFFSVNRLSSRLSLRNQHWTVSCLLRRPDQNDSTHLSLPSLTSLSCHSKLLHESKLYQKS